MSPQIFRARTQNLFLPLFLRRSRTIPPRRDPSNRNPMSQVPEDQTDEKRLSTPRAPQTWISSLSDWPLNYCTIIYNNQLVIPSLMIFSVIGSEIRDANFEEQVNRALKKWGKGREAKANSRELKQVPRGILKNIPKCSRPLKMHNLKLKSWPLIKQIKS